LAGAAFFAGAAAFFAGAALAAGFFAVAIEILLESITKSASCGFCAGSDPWGWVESQPHEHGATPRPHAHLRRRVSVKFGRALAPSIPRQCTA
jgi:hypothetical protein